MRFRWLLPSFLGILGSLLLSLPVEAARLQFWRFDSTENRLVFTTDSGVQPRAQLISNPTRLVIDLPGTTLAGQTLNQSVGGAIREVRVGQFDAQTARIVIELTPGYTLDPSQVQVRGSSPTQWSVQLPPAQQTGTPPIATSPTPRDQPLPDQPLPDQPPTSNGNAGNGVTEAPVADAATQLEGVRVTGDGFFVRLRGDQPTLNLERSRDRRQITIDLANTALSAQPSDRDLAIDRYGVNRIQLTQVQTSPPVARVTLDVDPNSPNWQATVSNLGGIVVVPTGGVSARAIGERVPSAPPEAEVSSQPATIQAVELADNGTQLLIRADQPLTHSSGWDQATASYQITIPSARLADQVAGPQLGTGSPLLRVRLLQTDADTVAIQVQPAAGVRVGTINQPGNQLLALQLETASRPAPTPAPSQTVPVTPPPAATTPPTRPQVPNRRVVVVIDPGHGGPDPGAVGIGGLREKDVVLPISLQVASLLEQQGIQVVLTRQDDRDLDLAPRVQIAQRANANLFVSIHANAISMSRPDVNGLETYYYSNSGLALAQTIHRNMLQGTGMNDRGVRQARFYVLRNTSMPAVLLETGFVTGRDDAARLADPAFRARMAEAIARGILQYVQQNF